ncbi:DUF4097 family beta strand repeat-containing protein [Secundilactobacillus malefermentans]|uniref:DUF4097 domain-containing protein n=1 Tax=Secundilactobacillus malefermentans TaxID=176292 RepID=A0A4R5NGK2_9LACO|nr:DUF4097 family beta strand repeat-containing protein [Secundilactobacillus malefermentans]KRM56261.1 hypothetical protein FD44_GL001750 [Secundilactobacillus malefermentans DSM 5705 = KCTC 3548]QEA31473.1 DUF4097 domain-containing protein [Secundilactobacillus malefermentans]TDG73646.1 hypothetical protein C5L31_001253 [Secundilactobacillus malefermentans]
MKKSLIAGAITLVVGLFILALGVGHGGAKSVYWQNGFKIDSRVSQSKQIGNVNEIELDTSRPVIIHRGDEAKVTVKSTKSSNTNISLNNSKRKLTVKGGSHPAVNLFFDEDYEDSQIEITIPKKTQLKTVSVAHGELTMKDLNVDRLNSRYSEITLDNVTSKNSLDLNESNYSDLELNRVTAPGLNAETDGEITVKNSHFIEQDSSIVSTNDDAELAQNSWRSLNVKLENGDLDFSQESIKKQFVARLSNGDIDGQIDQNKHNTIITDNDNGDTTLYGKDSSTYGDLKAKNAVLYRLINVNGDIDVTY